MRDILFLLLSLLALLGCQKNTEALAEDTYELDKFYQRVDQKKKSFAFSLNPDQVMEIYWQDLNSTEKSTFISLTNDQKVKVQMTEDGETKEETYELSSQDYEKILNKLRNPNLLQLKSEYTQETPDGFNLVLTFWEDLKERNKTKSVCCRTYFQPELFALLKNFSPALKGKLPDYEGMLSLLQAQKK